MGKTCEFQLKDAKVVLIDRGNGYQLRVIKEQFFHGNSLEAAIISIPAAFILGLLPVAAAAEWLHLFAAVFTGGMLYTITFFLVKKFTQNKRSETVTKLLQIADFAEMRLKELVDSEQTPGADSLADRHLNAKSIQGGNNKLRT